MTFIIRKIEDAKIESLFNLPKFLYERQFIFTLKLEHQDIANMCFFLLCFNFTILHC